MGAGKGFGVKCVSLKMAKGLTISLLFGWALMAGSSALAATVTDMAGRTVTIPAKVERILLGEGRLFYAVSLLEGKKPLDRIVGWQGDFRKLIPKLTPSIKQNSRRLIKSPYW